MELAAVGQGLVFDPAGDRRGASFRGADRRPVRDPAPAAAAARHPPARREVQGQERCIVIRAAIWCYGKRGNEVSVGSRYHLQLVLCMYILPA